MGGGSMSEWTLEAIQVGLLAGILLLQVLRWLIDAGLWAEWKQRRRQRRERRQTDVQR